VWLVCPKLLGGASHVLRCWPAFVVENQHSEGISQAEEWRDLILQRPHRSSMLRNQSLQMTCGAVLEVSQKAVPILGLDSGVQIASAAASYILFH
jgi:hypothetical protein